MTMKRQLEELTQLGVSVWLDDLDRRRLESGNLAELIAEWGVRGVTTNPSIFESALRNAPETYAEQLRGCAEDGLGVEQAVGAVTCDDVRAACDLFLPLWHSSAGTDGRVSIEVDPRLAHQAPATVAQARDLWNQVDRANAMIKIPATRAGLQAIAEVIGQGISVNVTLIFSPDRYREVLAAYARGLHAASVGGLDLASIHSVASVFVSRVDTAVDARLDGLGTPAAQALRGRAGVTNAQRIWGAYREFLASDVWARLSSIGARPQRPLWASTGVKDPALPDTWYVTELVGPGCVNTMPEATLRAVADHGHLSGARLTDAQTLQDAQQVWHELAELGLDADALFTTLEDNGVAAFEASWERLLDAARAVMSGRHATP